ncbi:MAG: flagellar biosynthetic protein FliR [Myxococcales bacterium]|nr:flagellar biosynthetic protein FliR [Myxococcales bacterium]
MSWVVWARVLPAVLALPLGHVGVRLAVGLALGGVLAGLAPAAGPLTIGGVVGEVLLGLTLGVLAGLPAHAGRALGVGQPPLGPLGHLLAWAVFFGGGGFVAWLSALGRTFAALPAAAWPDVAALVAAGEALFYAVVVLALPVLAVNLAVAPVGALLERLGAGAGGRPLAGALRPALGLLAVAVMLPLLLDVLRATWRVGLTGG